MRRLLQPYLHRRKETVFQNNYHDTILVVTQVFAFLFFSLMIYGAYQKKLARKHELSKQILEKLSSEKFLELLKSPDGRQSIERLLGSSGSPDEWVTDAVRRAILLLFAGPAFLVVYGLTDFSGHEMFLILGCSSVAIGIGYLVAAALTRGRARRANTDPAP